MIELAIANYAYWSGSNDSIRAINNLAPGLTIGLGCTNTYFMLLAPGGMIQVNFGDLIIKTIHGGIVVLDAVTASSLFFERADA